MSILGNIQGHLTKEDGSYSIELPVPGMYSVRLRKAGDYVTTYVFPELVELKEGGDKTGLDFALNLGGSISGTVFDPNENGIADADLHLFQHQVDGTGSRGTATTKEDGSYIFTGVEPGFIYVVRAAHRDFATGESKTAAMREVESVTGIDIRLVRGNAAHGNVIDSDGNGIEGLEVLLIRKGENPFMPFAVMDSRTDLDGSFRIPHLTPGDYQACIETAEYTRIMGPHFTMPADSDIYDIVIVAGSHVESFVSGAVTDTEGGAVSSAEVAVYGGNITGVTRTAPDGTYRIEGLASGRTYLVIARGRATGYTREQRPNVPAGSADVDFVLWKCGTIKGQVIDGDTGHPVTSFEILHPSGRWKEFSSPSGEFTITGILQETTSFRVRTKGYAPVEARGISAPFGKTVEGIIVELFRGHKIAGVVLDAATGKPVPNARVIPFKGELRWENLRRSTALGGQGVIADLEGRFEIIGEEGVSSINLSAWLPGYAPEVVMGLAGGQEDVTLHLGRGGTLVGIITSGGQPVPGANIVCIRTDLGDGTWDGFRYYFFCFASGTGKFEAANLPPGGYQVRCLKKTSRDRDLQPDWSGQAEIVEDAVTDLNVEL
ncbi:carboxypeptidase regulatory-like domain-containing protein [Candidatus Hydrogenedentota bacterium]